MELTIGYIIRVGGGEATQAPQMATKITTEKATKCTNIEPIKP